MSGEDAPATIAGGPATMSGDPAGLVDLADTRLGAMVVTANDEYFAPKEALLDPSPPRFDADAYTHRGKLMDGWETRRRRTPGSDWCVIRLGLRGIVHRLVVDTRFFRGNHPEACTVEQALVEDPVAEPDPDDWAPLMRRVSLKGDARNVFDVATGTVATHLRLWIHPDGGIARLRVVGTSQPDLRRQVTNGGGVDLAALVNGGVVVDASGEFFSPRSNLIMVGDARSMADGWETRRRRDDGHDWVIVRLATSGYVDRVEIDTTHFKGNSPASCSLEAADDSRVPLHWREVLPRTRLAPHLRHGFRISTTDPATHVRLRIFPDGGIARLRVFGRVTPQGWQRSGLRWLATLPESAAVAALLTCCGSRRWAGKMAAQRPYDSLAALLDASERLWWELEESDWEEAFAVHPRIGDRTGPARTRREQEGTKDASPQTLEALAEGNRAYEQRHDRVFIISATGRSAQDMLAALTARLEADPATEVRTAAGEQARITALRLERLIGPEGLESE